MQSAHQNDYPIVSATDVSACPCLHADETMLDQLPTGARATVLCVNCPTHMRKRLAEMGILPGVTVQMKRTAPMGDPIAFQVRGYQLSLRRSDAGLISVRQIAEPTLTSASVSRQIDLPQCVYVEKDQP